MVRPVGRGLDPSAGGCPGDGRWREVSRGVGDAAPYGLPGMGGGGRLPLIRPCGATFPQGGRQGLLLAAAQAFAGRRGRRPPTVCPGKGGGGSLPLIRPCGATFPRGGRQGLQGRDSSLPGMGGSGRLRRGGGTPPYGWGDMETLWGLREQLFPGRRAVGAGHARPGGLRRQASMVRSVGRGLDPSAGVGGSGSLRGW